MASPSVSSDKAASAATPGTSHQWDDALASVTISSRIPDFWTDQPKLWYAQFEAIITSQKLGDEAKFNLVVAKMNKQQVEQIGDLLFDGPATGKYAALKERLLDVYEESETRQLQKLLSEMDLGEQKPCVYWRVP